MKNNTFIAVVASMALTLMGCPYSSSVNLGKAEIKTDNSIIKTWKQGTDYFYKVLKYDEYSYTIKKISQSTNELSETYRGYITDVEGTKYMTVFTEGSTSPTHYFYKFEQANDKITLTPVTENIDETFTSSSDLFSFFKKNQKNSYFFDNDEDEYTPVEN